jgi:hypothetical protein
MPCRHIAAICRSNKTVFGENQKGFPLSSIRVFWWNIFYLYGMLKKTDHQTIKTDLVALTDNDTERVAFPSSTLDDPNLDDPSSFPVPYHVFKAFRQPAATKCLLNYGCCTA